MKLVSLQNCSRSSNSACPTLEDVLLSNISPPETLHRDTSDNAARPAGWAELVWKLAAYSREKLITTGQMTRGHKTEDYNKKGMC
jgi:hypothetical protein